MVAAALAALETATAEAIRAAVPTVTLKRWFSAVQATREVRQHCQRRLWSAPAEHSTRQIGEVLERITLLRQLGMDRYRAV